MAPTDNLTAVLYKAKDLRMENRPVPVPGDNDVLLKMACVGICGSDVHYLKEGRCCTFIVKKPMVCGHEGSGVVAEVGKNVKHLKPGDRVAIEPGVPCLSCEFCISGRYNLCQDIFFCATPPDDGNLCRYYKHNAAFCHKLPENVSNEEGALMEPLSVGVHACRQANLTYGKTVLITGSGPIGLVSLVAARAMGASKIIVTDVVEHRLQVAKTAGADAVVLVSKGTQEDHVNQIKQVLNGDLPDISLDCTGFEASIRLCLEATKSGGTIVIVGMGSHEVNIPIATALAREVTIKGVFRYCNDYPLAIKMVQSGQVNVKQFITHHYKLEETIEAFDTACTGRGNPIKVMIHCDK